MRGDAQNIDMTADIVDQTLDKKFSELFSVHSLSFSGGEPTLNVPLIDYILEKMVRNGIPADIVYIATNGKVYSPELVKSFQKFKRRFGENTDLAIHLSNDDFHKEADKRWRRHFDDGIYRLRRKFMAGNDFYKLGNAKEGKEFIHKDGMLLRPLHNGCGNFSYYTVDDAVYINAKGNINDTNFGAVESMDRENLGKLSGDAVALTVIFSRIENFALCLIWAAADAALCIISYNLGKKQFPRVREAIKKSMILMSAVCIPGAIVFSLLAPQICGIFNASDAVRDMSRWAFPVLAIDFLFIGVRSSAEGSIRALGRPIAVMWVILMRTYILIIPICFIAVAIGSLPLLFFSWAIVDIPSTAVMLIVLVKTKKKKLPSIIH
jgi:hypothetical protein